MRVSQLPSDYKSNVENRICNFRERFQTRYALNPNTAQHKLAESLVRQVGNIDAKIEGYSYPEKQRDLSIKFHWGHNHKFSESLEAAGRMKDRHLQMAAEFLEGFHLPEDYFQNKSVLDVGCWTGGTTLTLKLLGAQKITALEEVVKYAEVAEKLCRDVYELPNVKCISQSIYNYRTPDDQRFDCVFIPGVVYHLSDPVLALRLLYNQLNDGGDILVESAGIDHDGLMCSFHGNKPKNGSIAEQSRGGWNWFMPSARCLGEWLQTAGFEDVQVFRSPMTTHSRVFAYGRRKGFTDITRAGLSVPDVS